MTQHALTLMRHATTVFLSDRDHTRALTPAGLDEARRVGVRMAERAEAPDRIFASTALRCRQTRDALCAGLGHEIETEFDDALYNASQEGLLDAVAGQDETGSLLILAHNPGISMLALALCAGRSMRAETDASLAENGRAAARTLHRQWRRMQGGFAPAATARFEVHGSWPELAPHTSQFLRFEDPPSAAENSGGPERSPGESSRLR